VPSGPGIPNINADTGLSTDYLNHFTEAIMALEMVGTMPECLDDLQAWRPKTYIEHFAASGFSNRNAVIRAYHAADPAARQALEAASQTINAILVATCDAVIHNPNAEALTRRALDELRPLIARMAALINGKSNANRTSAQAAIDAMFGR
jgi:hypothetical protein